MTTSRAKTLLSKGCPLILTHTTQGPSYSIDGHGTVPLKLARGLTGEGGTVEQPDLFLWPNDDGLFPGFSQT